MLKAYKYRLYPTDEQKVLFAKTFGCCRFVYNWGLSLKRSAYKEKKETLSNIYITNLMRSELKSKNIIVNLYTTFDMQIVDMIYRETSNYLAR